MQPAPRFYRLAQIGAAIVVIGGVFDVSIGRLLPHHESFLGVDRGAAPPATAALILLLLRTLGFALIAVGIAALGLLAAWRRTGDQRFAWTAAAIVMVAEGVNAWAIFSVGSPLFVGPLVAAAMVTGAVLSRS